MLLDRYQGCLLGLAIGDALGAPVEFLSLAQIRQHYGPEGITDLVAMRHFAAGTYTDDTQMSIALAEGLLDCPAGDLSTQMAAVARRFVAWSSSPENNRAPGNTCLRACSNLARGIPWQQAGVAGSKGCGTAMRAAPVGLRYHRDAARLQEVAVESSRITHGHRAALAAAAAVAAVVSAALDDATPEQLDEVALTTGAPGSPEVEQRLRQIPTVLDLDPPAAFEVLGEAWVAEEALACGLYCVLRTPDDYRATVLAGANSTGDSDTIACIAGAISGARLGSAAIPAAWRQQVENRELLLDLATRLHQAWQADQV
ncbi:MAG: ADP-ribosylglycohydrolase family protein [Fimbriimonadaceae bacterium]|nr:ADP-ribosylglycohydrolase family protein [Fimbriimonadaceae bacterium]